MRRLILFLLLAGMPLAANACPSLLDHRYTSLQGKPVNLCEFANRPVLVVNTAGKCGYTPSSRSSRRSTSSIEKGSVRGAGASPLYRQLAAATGEAPRWNFHKYLIAPDGKTVYSFDTRVEPDAPEIMQRLLPMLRQP